MSITNNTTDINETDQEQEYKVKIHGIMKCSDTNEQIVSMKS